CVIERDRGDDGEPRRRDVGRVETPSQTHLENGEVQRPLGKEEKRGGRQGFEVSEGNLRGAIHRLEHAGERRIELFLRRVLFFERESFGHANQMGGRVETGANAGGGGDRRERGRRRTFTVGSGDQDRGYLPFRPAEPLADRIDRVQTQPHAAR